MSTMDIIIVPYQSTWPEEYQSIIRTIRPAVPHDAKFHHIGSTAVPGLGAKDVIDLQITVSSLNEIKSEILESLDFVERHGYKDHCPIGEKLDDSQLAKRFFRGTRRPANVHVRVEGKFNQRYPLLCRDYLRAHPITAASYEEIKRRLASWFPRDIGRYLEIKDPLFDIMMEGAKLWAQTTQWTVPPSDM